MERPEVPLEPIHEEIRHRAEEATAEKKWILGVALSSAIVAALAAVASLRAGHKLNDALLNQLHSNEQWAYYQTRGIKAIVLSTKIELLDALGKSASAQDKTDAARFGNEIDKIKEKARDMEKESIVSLQDHERLASAVTMYQVCIAVAAVSVLTGKKAFWWVSLFFALVGLVFTIMGFLNH